MQESRSRLSGCPAPMDCVFDGPWMFEDCIGTPSASKGKSSSNADWGYSLSFWSSNQSAVALVVVFSNPSPHELRDSMLTFHVEQFGCRATQDDRAALQ